MGVFATTTFFSIFAYIWLYYCLLDNIVTGWEAGITFGLTFVFIIVAYVVDKAKECRQTNQNDN